MRIHANDELYWNGNHLRLRSRSGRILATVIPDARWPGMWRVKLPNGFLSDLVNLSRAKDAATALVLAALNCPTQEAA
jgi:hypothetical protein